MKEEMTLPKKELRPSQIGDSVTLLYSDSTQLKVVLKANRMLIFNKNVTEPYTLLPKGLFVTFFDDQEKVSATLRKEIIMGTGMESNQDFTKYEIKHVTGQIQINTDEK